MNCNQLRVGFAGTPEFAMVALNALLESSHQVVGVLTQPDRPAGRGRKLSASPVKLCALKADVPVEQPLNLKHEESLDIIRAWQVDVLVVAAYGLILPKSFLQLAPLGCLNIHASLLPRWRGAAPIHRAIQAGDSQTGISIMQMDEGLDTGDILLQASCDIDASDTSARLHDKLALLGAQTLLEALPLHCLRQLPPVSQPDAGVTYASKLSKHEAQLDFSDSAVALDRHIRAFNPWPVAEAGLCGQRVRIWDCRLPEKSSALPIQEPGTILAIDEAAIRVKTGDGEIELLTLQWPGKKAQNAAVFAQTRALQGERFSRSNGS